MLNKTLIMEEGGRSITFKYMTPQHFVDTVFPAVEDESNPINHEKYRDRRRALQNAAGGLKHRLESGDNNNKSPLSVTDLAVHKVVLLGLLRSVVCAQRAAKAAASLFAASSNWDRSSSRLGKSILEAYFNGTSNDKHLRTIAAVLQQTAAGLSGNLVVSDLAGREERAEGSVRLKSEANAQMQSEWGLIEAKLESRSKELKDKRHKLEIPRVDEEMNLLMARYLAAGPIGSIHVQFSLCFKYSLLSMARVIVHEATHKFAATADFGYVVQRDLTKYLTVDHAVLNADSYAYAAVSALAGELVTPDTIEKGPKALHESSVDSALILSTDK